MTYRTEKDFKENLADLAKIPPNEFEKHFHDWMERDDVARGLQAKLRCDLIKNFNKTNLGKHIISHTTMSSSGGSTTRLTLSPLILALNSLVAEFLYAQNCHFTLSVFCTEIPFRNTLPDFESMRNFRFSSTEIAEIWEAVTGSVANKKDLNKYIIESYKTDSSTSLLLLIVKCLLEQKPVELLRKSVEIQTEMPQKSQRSTAVQASEEERKSPSKSPAKDDNLYHINEYLSTLADKVNEMTKEFEQLSKQRNLPRPIRSLRTSRSREYYTINRSLERITDNMKQISQAKRKNKRLSNIVEAIENLTQQFGKCTQNFDNVTKVLSSKEQKTPREREKSKEKVSSKEKQTETEKQEKSYADWIHEMRTTANGQKFLDRVEISLRKALTKHRDQLQSETDIKMKHVKNLLKLHYQQKLEKRLMQQEPKENFDENRKLNENIEKKLQQFELKQLELMQQLRESSFEIQEAQRRQKEKEIEREEPKDRTKETSEIQRVLEQPENRRKYQEIEISKDRQQKPELKENTITQDSTENVEEIKSQQKEQIKLLPEKKSIKDVTNTQEQISNTVEQGRTVDHIIYDAKLRMQQLENESNQLEQNFQSYLERRKRDQLLEQQTLEQNFAKLIKQPQDQLQNILLDRDRVKNSELACNKTNKRKIIFQKIHTKSLTEDGEDEDEEFDRMREILHESEKESKKPMSAKSDSTNSSLELGNAILEAKFKFFEQETTFRQSKEQDLDIIKYPELYDTTHYRNQNFGQYQSETNINFCLITPNKDKNEFNVTSSLSEVNVKDKTLDEEQEINLSPLTEEKSEKLLENKEPAIIRRELFPRETITREEVPQQQFKRSKINSKLTIKPFVKDIGQQILRYHEPIPVDNEDLRQALKGIRNFTETKENKEVLEPATTSRLIKQSMAKMQQLFEQQPQEIAMEMKQEMEEHKRLIVRRDSKIEDEIKTLDFNTTTTSTTATTNQTTTTATTTSPLNEELHIKTQRKMFKSIDNLNRISNTSMPSILNITSESEESLNSLNEKLKRTSERQEDFEGTEKELMKVDGEDQFKISDESYISSEYHLLPTPSGDKQKMLKHPEIGEDNESLKDAEINVLPSGNEMEIGEILSESKRTFAPIDVKLSDSSSQTSIDLEISTGKRNRFKAKVNTDDSESDFWT